MYVVLDTLVLLVCSLTLFLLMIRLPPRSTRTNTLFPYTTLFRSLEPTTATGTLSIDFIFRDDKVVRKQTIEAWLDPGDRPWTVVGFAAGTLGYNTLGDRIEPVAETLDDLSADARLALYAKGRVLGTWLMTLAYDSYKDEDYARLDRKSTRLNSSH